MCGDCSSSGAASGLPSSEANSAEHASRSRSAPLQQEDFSGQEFRAFCQKRLDLFLQYKQRQDEKVGCQGTELLSDLSLNAYILTRT